MHSNLLKELVDSCKLINISANLSKKYGGKWKYDHHGSWWCDDDKRFVRACSMCGCDEPCGHATSYFLYGDGPTVLVDWS